jgi:hypothetical protein
MCRDRDTKEGAEENPGNETTGGPSIDDAHQPQHDHDVLWLK